MKRAVLTVLLASATLAVAAPALAGTQDGAVLALHRTALAKKASLTCSGDVDPITTNTPCSAFVTTGPLLEAVNVYLVVANAQSTAGIAGLSCGITYDATGTSGVDIFGWTLCSDLEFPNMGWPAAGSGNRITWSAGTNCQRTEVGGEGVQAIAGAFYVYAYSSDDLELTANTAITPDELQVADCATAVTNVMEGGIVSFGLNSGCNPCIDECIIVPVESTTWGKIKTIGGE